MKINRSFNGYLGFEPVSVFVELMPRMKYLTTLEANYKMIKCEGTNDIIFQGVILRNLDFIKWVCCRLMSEGHYLSVVLDMNELEQLTPEDLIVHRIILKVDEEAPIVRFTKICEKLTDKDIVLVKTGDIKVLNLIYEKMKEVGCPAHLYVDMELMDSKKVLLHGFDTIYPYFGEI